LHGKNKNDSEFLNLNLKFGVNTNKRSHSLQTTSLLFLPRAAVDENATLVVPVSNVRIGMIPAAFRSKQNRI
jgi:hypothetical protein